MSQHEGARGPTLNHRAVLEAAGWQRDLRGNDVKRPVALASFQGAPYGRLVSREACGDSVIPAAQVGRRQPSTVVVGS